ncbi:MAG: M protein [Actinomycetota bacterium]|uniref:M protein n=1 Tax=Mycobacterium lentiflavum TaxID=141349 RepID=A0ABY3V536_MYCLN|nr:M protein [Mycobacterium lentiflavum]MEE3066457.1 M protein [Actinomycetota bacterium]ULP44689.1 M protein [Mycobacterium lentiflavum]
MKRLSWHLEKEDSQLSDLRALARQGDSRIDTLRDQLGRSHAELESVSARFTEVAAAIPDDIGFLGDRLAAILNAASLEAEEIKGEARRFAETVRVNAEEGAAEILADAQRQYQSATTMRDEVEAECEQARADIALLREQAAADAAEILVEAKDQAEAALIRVQRQVDAQVAAAKAKLDELNGVRAKVIAQLKDFYDTFNTLDRPWGEDDPVRTISPSSDRRSAYGAHSARDVDGAHELLGDVG